MRKMPLARDGRWRDRIEVEMEQTVEHRGCKLSYRIRGTGPRVLFIQGVGVHGDGWQPQTDDLSDRFTCLSFDNRGMGRSQPVGTAVTVDQMADDTRAILDAAGWPTAHIVGHSLGGLIAVTLALAARDRVASLALLCTFSGGPYAAPLSARMIWLGLRSRVGTRAMRRAGFLRLVLPPTRRTPEFSAEKLADLFGHDLADQPPIVGSQLKAMRAADATRRLGELKGIPTLVMAAAHDPIAPPQSGRKLAEGIPSAKYVEVADASHGLPITHAELINRSLCDHFHAAGQ
jgi:pimeloyl-ACP methyl ester carboxylesterase